MEIENVLMAVNSLPKAREQLVSYLKACGVDNGEIFTCLETPKLCKPETLRMCADYFNELRSLKREEFSWLE